MRLTTIGSCILLATAAAACSEQVPTTPSTERPAHSFMNGPVELPNLYRFEATVLFWMRDPASGLVVAANLPQNPSDARFCGGTQVVDPVPMQHVGEARDVWHMLSNDGHAMLHVFDNADIVNARSFCTATPLAVGLGRFMNNDNDLEASGTRANSYGYHLTGTVEMADGSSARLNAFAHYLYAPGQGAYRLVSRWIRLN